MKKISVVFAVMLLLSACSTTPAKKPFSVDLRSPKYTAGSAEVQFEKLLSLGGLQKDKIDVFYYPAEDAVCLEYRVDFVTHSQFWSRVGREAFTSALERYKEDYGQRKLVNSSKTKRSYGKVQGYLSWRTLSFSGEATGNPNIEMGYSFVNKSPYFSIMQSQVEYIDPEANSNSRKSPRVVMYLTRAQAEDLALLFDQKYLQWLSGSFGTGSSVDKDDY